MHKFVKELGISEELLAKLKKEEVLAEEAFQRINIEKENALEVLYHMVSRITLHTPVKDDIYIKPKHASVYNGSGRDDFTALMGYGPINEVRKSYKSERIVNFNDSISSRVCHPLFPTIENLGKNGWALVGSKLDNDDGDITFQYYHEELETYLFIEVNKRNYTGRSNFMTYERLIDLITVAINVKKDQEKVNSAMYTDEEVEELRNKYYNLKRERIRKYSSLYSVNVSNFSFYTKLDVNTVRNNLEKCFEVYPRMPEFKILLSPAPKGKRHIVGYNVMHKALQIETLDHKLPSLRDDFDLNYNFNANDLMQDLQNYMRTHENGMMILKGIPGTGKSNFIRKLTYLLSKHEDIETLTIPVAYVERLGDPEMQTLIRDFVKTNPTLIVIEDAEAVLRPRDKENRNSAATSFMLNVGDGDEFGDNAVFVLATVNTEMDALDKAILRPGRMFAEIEFGKLTADRANKLAKHIKLDKTFDEELTVAQIYAMKNMEQIGNNETGANQERITVGGYKLDNSSSTQSVQSGSVITSR